MIVMVYRPVRASTSAVVSPETPALLTISAVQHGGRKVAIPNDCDVTGYVHIAIDSFFTEQAMFRVVSRQRYERDQQEMTQIFMRMKLHWRLGITFRSAADHTD